MFCLFLLLLSLSFLTHEMEMKLQDTGCTLHWQDLPAAEAAPVLNWVTAGTWAHASLVKVPRNCPPWVFS